MIQTELVTTDEEFLNLKQEWNELLAESASDSLFLTWEWQYTWWRNLAGDRKLNIITLRDNDKLVAVAPLVIRPAQPRRLIFFRSLEFIGAGTIGSDYLGILIHQGYEEESVRAISASLTESQLSSELTQIDISDDWLTGVTRQLRQLGWRTARTTTDLCPYIDLTNNNWDSYLSSLSSSHRYNFRRRLRQLKKKYSVRLEEVGSEARREKALETLVRLHRKRWDTRGGSNALERRSHLLFHQQMTRLAFENGWLKLFILWLDDKPAAALYGFKYAGKFYFYQSGFDPVFSKLSVGLVIMGLVIKNAIEDDLQEYDFLHGNESYKYSWTDRERELVRLDLFPPSTKGVISKRLMEARWKLKPVMQRISPASLPEDVAPSSGTSN